MKCFKLILFFTLNIQIILCDEFVIIKNRPSNPTFTEDPKKCTLLCITDTIKDAIVWNTNLQWEDRTLLNSDRSGLMKVSELSRNGELIDKERKCDINLNTDECEVSFSHEKSVKWRKVFSSDVPMGPVFDSRWETFEENMFAGSFNAYEPVTINKNGNTEYFTFRTSGTFVVSIRSIANAHIVICNGIDSKDRSCYWIIIGGWGNAKSVIRKCVEGVDGTPPGSTPCGWGRVKTLHQPLSRLEWKTFVVTWNAIEDGNRIIVYDSNSAILDYTDRDEDRIVSSQYYILIGNSYQDDFPTLFRVHHYDYWFTNESRTFRSSGPLNINSNNEICIDMMIGLCASCQFHFYLISNGEHLMVPKIFNASKSQYSPHDLPLWQYVRISVSNLDKKNGPVTLQMSTKSTDKINNHFAIRDLHQCQPKGTVKRIKMIASQDRERRNFNWPQVRCQKLSYNELDAQIISPQMDITVDETDPLSNLTMCPEKRIGPHCATFCDTYFDDTCRGTIICNKNRCYCPQGYKSFNCFVRCDSGEFGYGCKQTCENCSLNQCNIYTGHCTGGCKKLSSERQYVSPYCKDVVDFPELKFNQMNRTTLRIYFPKYDHDKKFNITYEFEIEVDSVQTKQDAENGTLDRIPIYFTTFNNLREGMKYRARVSQRINYESFDKIEEVTVNGDFSKQSYTMCIWSENFEFEVEDEYLTIKKNDFKSTYTCPDNRYSVRVSPAGSTMDLNKKFPMTVRNLIPDTDYVIFITGMNSTFVVRQEVRTRPKRSSAVRTLGIEDVRSTEATVDWLPPEYPNGVIYYYNLTIKALSYIDCNNSLPKNSISAQSYRIANESDSYTIKNLMPYVNYEVTISADHKRRGEEKSITFETKATDVPTAVYKNLTFINGRVKWSRQVDDCSTVTGPIGASKLFFFGESENVKDFIAQYDVYLYSFTLNYTGSNRFYGNEEYRVRVHALRNIKGKHNESAYKEIIFTTDPQPPPKVRNLTIVEVDTIKRTMSLRWKPPLPPTNGQIINYKVEFREIVSNLATTIVSPYETCSLWGDYLCKTVDHPSAITTYIEDSHSSSMMNTMKNCEGQIHQNSMNVESTTPHKILYTVSAMNNGTDRYGDINSITDEFEVRAPKAPGRVFISKKEREKVDVYWEHPFITGGPMKEFIIQRELISTKLLRNLRDIDRNKEFKYQISSYNNLYKLELDVLPSSHYKIHVRGSVENPFDRNPLYGDSSSTELDTKSSFSWLKDKPSYTVDNTSHIITLSLPLIANYIKSGLVNVVVIGEPFCQKVPILSESLAKDIELADGEVAWHVGTFRSPPLSIPIGDYPTNDNFTKCPLREGNSYVIVIVVCEETSVQSDQAEPFIWRSERIQIGPVPRQPHEIWAVPLLLLIIIIVGLVCYLTRKKKRIKKSPNNVMVDVPQSVASLKGAWKNNIKSTPPQTSLSMTQRPNTVQYRESVLVTPADSLEHMKPTPINEETYEKIKCTSLLKLNEFQDYVKRAIASGKLNEQYSLFPRGQMKSWAYGELPENRKKNRYGNLIAYDDTRVILEKLPGDPHSDYINANYIKGYKKNRAYIATQGPKATTVIDFWRMIWQERVQVICMLANVMESGKIKCEQYWPEIGKVIKYGNISVSNISHVRFADYTFRIFHVKCDQEIRKIDHLHYTAWPDHGIPLYTHSVVSYLKKLLATPSGSGPIVVHCSAGVGRTGTIILCDICLRRAAAEGVVDVFGEIDEMRKQRANMVDNIQQYILTHVALVECLLSLPTAIPCNDSLPTRIQEYKNQLSLQQQRLEQSAWQDEALQSSPRAQLKLSAKNIAKNRFPDLVPVTRLYIPRYPITDDDSSYIYGVHVDSARRQNNFIATQLPLPTTVTDFWRMVAEFKVQLIIILQPPDTGDPTCCKFVPDPDEEISPFTFLNIKGKSITDGKYCTQQKISLINNSTEIPREQSVKVVTCKEWDPGRNKPPPKPEALVDLWQVAERISRSDEPAVVMCHDGVTGCGLYLAMSFLLERMGLEHECDVCLAIGAIRRSRSDFCQTREQFEYLYDAALIYNGYFETYANFT